MSSIFRQSILIQDHAKITPRAERDLSLLVNGYVYKSIRLRRKDGPVRKKSIESTDDDDGASRKPFFTKNREGADKTQGNDKTDTTTTPRTQMLHSASTSNASHAVKHVDMIFSASSSNKRRELNDEVGIPSAEWAVKQPMRTVSIPSGKDFRFYEGYQSDLTPLQDLHLSSERSNSSTDVSTIDSDSERSFVASTAAAPRIVSVDTEALLLIMGKGLALKVLEGFLSTFPGTTSATTDTSSRRGASQVSIVAAVSESRALQGNTPAAKRSADSRDDSEDADEDDRGNTKRQRRTAPSSGSAKLLLACPYFKLDPVRYSERNVQERCYRGCASSLLRNIPRLKQHLYRVHRRPEYYCGRCYVSFDTQALANMHSRQNQSCTVVEPQFEEKMDNDQMNAIKRRNRRVNPPAEWYSIFKILFPDSSLPASPYADRSSTELLQNFMSYFQEEAPSIISEHVRTALNGRIFLSEQTQDLLDETFEQAVSQLLLGFEARLEDMDAFPGTGEEVIREHTTDSTTSLNRLTPGSNAGDAAQDFLGHGNSIDPSDFLFGVASDSWLETNFFD